MELLRQSIASGGGALWSSVCSLGVMCGSEYNRYQSGCQEKRFPSGFFPVLPEARAGGGWGDFPPDAGLV
jgi:hypothetical protein